MFKFLLGCYCDARLILVLLCFISCWWWLYFNLEFITFVVFSVVLGWNCGDHNFNVIALFLVLMLVVILGFVVFGVVLGCHCDARSFLALLC